MAAYCQVYGVIHFTSPAGWLSVHRDQLRAERSVTSMGKLYLFTHTHKQPTTLTETHTHRTTQPNTVTEIDRQTAQATQPTTLSETHTHRTTLQMCLVCGNLLLSQWSWPRTSVVKNNSQHLGLSSCWLSLLVANLLACKSQPLCIT